MNEKKLEKFEFVESPFSANKDAGKPRKSPLAALANLTFQGFGNQKSPSNNIEEIDEELSDIDIPQFIPVTPCEFRLLFDKEGRLIKELELRQSVFHGGCHDKCRREVWTYLFGLYPMLSTQSERESIDIENHYRYHALKSRCDMFIKDSYETNITNDTESIENESSSSNEACDNSLSQDILLPKYIVKKDDNGNKSNLSPDDSTLENYQNMAKIYAWSRRANVEDVVTWYKVIDKDIPRTDYSHPYFDKGEEVMCQMKSILATFGFFHPNIGYVQGMNDILTRFVIVMDSEVDAYWCFSNYMERVEHDFDEDGMFEKVTLVKDLLQELEPNLYMHFVDCSVEDLVFCHRWLLLSFKREFDFESSVTYFEILQSQHLSMDSPFDNTNETEKDETLSSDTTSSPSEAKPNSTAKSSHVKFTFEVFVCVAVIMIKRQEFFACTDAAEVFSVASNVTGTINLQETHCKAYKLFYRYWKKHANDNSFKNSVLNSFNKVLKWKWK